MQRRVASNPRNTGTITSIGFVIRAPPVFAAPRPAASAASREAFRDTRAARAFLQARRLRDGTRLGSGRALPAHARSPFGFFQGSFRALRIYAARSTAR